MDTETTPADPSRQDNSVLFTEKAISAASILGGPFAGTYLIARNFRTLGKLDAARRTYVIGSFAALVVIPLIMLIPDKVIPELISRMLNLLWVLPTYFIVRRFQQVDIDRHLKSGGKKGSAWSVAGVSVISTLIFVAYAFAIAILISPPAVAELPQFPAAAVHLEYSRGLVYYDSTALSEGDAKAVAAMLQKVGYFDSITDTLDALFYKQGDDYVVAFFVIESALSNKRIEKTLKQAVVELHQLYPNRKYVFRMLAMDADSFRGEKSVTAD